MQFAPNLVSTITGILTAARITPGPAVAAGAMIGAMAAGDIQVKLSCLNAVLEMCDAVGLLPDDKDWRSSLKHEAKVCTITPP